MKRASIIVLVIGFIYAVLPDPLPGPIDDVLVNLLTISISVIMRKLGDGVTRGVNSAAGKVRGGIDRRVDEKVAAGKMSVERAESVKQATANAHADAMGAVSEAVDVACARKITGFK